MQTNEADYIEKMADEMLHGDVTIAINFIRQASKKALLVFIDKLAPETGYTKAINMTFDLL